MPQSNRPRSVINHSATSITRLLRRVKSAPTAAAGKHEPAKRLGASRRMRAIVAAIAIVASISLAGAAAGVSFIDSTRAFISLQPTPAQPSNSEKKKPLVPQVATTVFTDDFSTNTNATYTTSGAIGASAWSVLSGGTVGQDFGARRNIAPAQLELTNDATGSTNQNGWVRASTPSSSFISPYNTTLTSNPGLVTWTFNMQQIRTDPAGFGAGSYGVAFILAGTATTNNNTGSGFAVVLGQSGATDPIRLARYNNGIQGTLTNIITSNTSGLTDFGADYLSIKVTYLPSSNTWELFLRNDGASAFADPAGGTLISQGTAFDNTNTAISLPLMGAWWQGSTGGGQTAFFDNTTVTVDTAPAPTLGDYSDLAVSLSANATATPSATPANATNISATTDSRFKGTFAVNPTTGVLSVTDAHPAGTYPVTVKAFGGGVSVTDTFTLTVTSGTACGGSVAFTDNGSHGVGNHPYAAAISDFNNDGNQDVATANAIGGANSFSILPGNGLGGFGAATTISGFSAPENLAVGDFNGDGNQDLAIVNTLSNTVAIRLGNGSGTSFTSAANVSVGSNPGGVAVGDFNNDGKQDLAVAVQVGSTIAVRLGDGTGGFSGSTNLLLDSDPYGVAIGDLDNDGDQDIAAVVPGLDEVAIRLGDGAGNFTPAPDVAVGDKPFELAIGRFDNDAFDDLAVANSLSASVSIRLGSGTGTFTNAPDLSVGTNPQKVAIGDFNNDGAQDLAITNPGSNNVSIRLGDGAGGFNATTDVTVSSSPRGIAIGDFNEDGRQDFVATTPSAHSVSIRLGNCLLPEMDVQGAGNSILDGDASPDVADDTEFGNVGTGGNTLVRTFTILNTGPGELRLTDTPKVQISGSADFSVTAQPSSPVAAATGSTTFQITFDPSAVGPQTATVSIANTDADENPYTFAIQGTGVPSVDVTVSSASEDEDAGVALVYTFKRSYSAGSLVVNFSVSGTAVADVDYTVSGTDVTFTAPSGTVTFNDGEKSKDVHVTPSADGDYEGDETVVLTVDSGPGYSPGPDGSATGTIINDDAPPATLEVNTTDDVDDTLCDATHCSLREAIRAANFASDPNMITFNILTTVQRYYYADDGAGSSNGTLGAVTPTTAADDSLITGTAIDPDYPHSWWSIRPLTPLPQITSPVFIDGYTQRPCAFGGDTSPCSQMSTDVNGNDADPLNDVILLIELNGSNPGAAGDGLVINGGDSIVTGLAINHFTGTGIALGGGNGGNEVIGNFIGTDVSGTLAAANHVGVFIDNTSENMIGCTSAEERNVISGNTAEGIEIYGSAVPAFNATLNVVQGNFIGTDRTGTVALGNGAAGVQLYDASENLIGGGPNIIIAEGNRLDGAAPGVGPEDTPAAPGNVIGGNGSHGIEIASGIPMTPGQLGNIVQGNFIGTNIDGTANVGNAGTGIAIYDSSNNIIGGTSFLLDNNFGNQFDGKAPGNSTEQAVPPGNDIANNGGGGVLVEETAGGPNRATGNVIRGNSIYNNTGLGIDLTPNAAPPLGAGDGVTQNDAGDGDPLPGNAGPNELQNFPAITSVHVPTQTIVGELDSTPDNPFGYIIDFYANASCDATAPNDYGEGQIYLGSIITDPTDGTGHVTFSFDNSSGPIPFDGTQVITATATDIVGNTSEFSQCSAAPSAANGTISGRVLDDHGAAVAGVVISLSGTQQRKTITNAKGDYLFDSVETNGFYTVTPSRVNYNFSPSNRSFSQLGNHTEAAFNASTSGNGANPLDTAEFFVRQQYVDLLGREPDEGGFNYWSNELLHCGSDATCTNRRRRDIAAAFFIEQEFQQSGAYIYNLYSSSLGRKPRYAEYAADRRLVVGGANLEAEKAAFAERFVQRADFMQKYQAHTTADAFVDALLATVQQSAGVDLSSARATLISKYNSGANQTQSRSLALRGVAENKTFKQAEYNAAFVLTEYFSYLRRDPEPEGYDFWLNVLNNREPGNFLGMVCSFITSTEYQKRFSSVVTHSNAECGR